jgi:hypothetical protein
VRGTVRSNPVPRSAGNVAARPNVAFAVNGQKGRCFFASSQKNGAKLQAEEDPGGGTCQSRHIWTKSDLIRGQARRIRNDMFGETTVAHKAVAKRMVPTACSRLIIQIDDIYISDDRGQNRILFRLDFLKPRLTSN